MAENLSSSLILNIFPVNILLERFGYSEISGVPCGWRSTFGCARRRYWIYAPSAWIGTWLWPGQSVILRQVPLDIRENNSRERQRERERKRDLPRITRQLIYSFSSIHLCIAKRLRISSYEILRVIFRTLSTRDTQSSWTKVFFYGNEREIEI